MTNKVVWITGAASGIGLACAKRFSDDGAIVVGSDIKANDDWQNITPNGHWIDLDVCDEAAVFAARDEIKQRLGRIDTVVTAAGVAGGGAVHHLSLQDWNRVIDINLNGTMLIIKAAVEVMMEQKSGSIVTVASVEGLEGSEGGSAYNASKGAVVLLTKNVAMDFGRQGIRANCICPGFIETPMFDEVLGLEAMQSVRSKIEQQHKLGRFGRPEEVASAAAFLAGEDASFITGQSLAVDGGYTAGHSYGLVEMMGLG